MQHAISLGTTVIPRRNGVGGCGWGLRIRFIMGGVQVANKRFTERR